jgi:hypothetical protein
MEKVPVKYGAVWFMTACLTVFALAELPAAAAGKTKLALKNGSVWLVDDFKAKGDMVEIRKDGTLFSLPAMRVDFDKSARLNLPEEAADKSPDSRKKPAGASPEKGETDRLKKLDRGTGEESRGLVITNDTLKELFDGKGDWVPGIVSDKPSRAPSKPASMAVGPRQREGQQSGELEKKQEAMDELASRYREKAQKLQELRTKYNKEDQVIDWVLRHGGNPNAVGGNIYNKAYAETEIKHLEREITDLATQYKKLEQEIRHLHGPTSSSISK